MKPSIILITDPAIVTEEDHAQLVAALDALAVAHGAEGIELISTTIIEVEAHET